MNADKFRQERAIETIPMIEIGNLAFAISRRFLRSAALMGWTPPALWASWCQLESMVG